MVLIVEFIYRITSFINKYKSLWTKGPGINERTLIKVGKSREDVSLRVTNSIWTRNIPRKTPRYFPSNPFSAPDFSQRKCQRKSLFSEQITKFSDRRIRKPETENRYSFSSKCKKIQKGLFFFFMMKLTDFDTIIPRFDFKKYFLNIKRHFSNIKFVNEKDREVLFINFRSINLKKKLLLWGKRFEI